MTCPWSRAGLCLVLLALSPWASLAQAPAAADRSKCSSCHAALTADKKVHAAARNDGCKACHELAKDGPAGKCQSAEGASWRLLTAQPALCQKCHSETATEGKLHAPIKSGGCTSCHDPHASKNPTLMKAWPVEETCYKCHARVEEKSVHSPVRKGDCKGCHDPHSSPFAPLLVAEKSKLCFECHKPEKLKHGKVDHTPFAEGKCLGCHDAHGSDAAPVLKAGGKELCLSCHDVKAASPIKVRPAFRVDLGKKKIHKPVQSGDCQDCHTQKHGADNRNLLKTATSPETCYRCHQKFDDLPHQHGAVKTGKCTVCHDPHSANEAGLLRASKKDQVCFLCHKDDLTGRRLIHKPVQEKGCTACHDPHGSDYAFNLIDGEGKDLCYKCHKPVDKVRRPHAALTRDGCTGCHDPHGSNLPALLGKSVNALCTSCHEAQATGTHVSTPPHKMSGGSDPKRKDREFSCISCHNPHGTDNPGLFYFGSTKQGMCVYCHGDKLRERAQAVRP